VGSPVPAINQHSRRFETLDPPVAVEVYVDEGVKPGWYFGMLREWTHSERAKDPRGGTAAVARASNPTAAGFEPATSG